MKKLVRTITSVKEIDVEEFKRLFKKLFEFKTNGAVKFNKNPQYGYSKGDEDAPFFSECYLYNLLGKDDARSVQAILYCIAKQVLSDDEVNRIM